jgi:uncharacterized Fe-S cluster-containing protein
MTKSTYFEMCEALNSEPVESEIPVDFDDMCDDVQEAIIVYNMLQDSWDYMNGNYIGKNYAGLFDILEIEHVSDKQLIFKLLGVIDRYRSKAIIANKKKTPAK